jgi:polar amino acid transport system substrate-binding protein
LANSFNPQGTRGQCQESQVYWISGKSSVTQFAFQARRLAAVHCLWLVLVAAPALADEPLRIGRNEGPNALLTDLSVAVLQSAYDKLGVQVRFEGYPLLRSLALANAGTIDGDIMRVAEASEQYANLLRVDVPINYLEITAYARTPCPTLSNWGDLQGKRVAYERGVLAIERRVKGRATIQTRNKPELFRLLSRGMVDVAVGTGLETDVVLRRSADKDQLCRVSGILERVPLYHYLHKRHAALAQRLQTQLQAMQRRGEIDAILRREQARLMGE